MKATKILFTTSLVLLLSPLNYASANNNAEANRSFKVANVKMANVLNVRQKPSMNSRVILQLPADARWIVKRTSKKQGHWQKVVWGVKEGWVYNRYLGEDPKATQFLAEHRQCVKQNPTNSMCCGFKSSSRNNTHHEIKTFMVVNVPRGESLNVRVSGSATSKRIANIPHNAVGVVKFPGQQVKHGRATWQKIRWNGRDGWVNTRYLKYDPITSDYRNIVQQTCSR